MATIILFAWDVRRSAPVVSCTNKQAKSIEFSKNGELHEIDQICVHDLRPKPLRNTTDDIGNTPLIVSLQESFARLLSPSDALKSQHQNTRHKRHTFHLSTASVASWSATVLPRDGEAERSGLRCFGGLRERAFGEGDEEAAGGERLNEAGDRPLNGLVLASVSFHGFPLMARI